MPIGPSSAPVAAGPRVLLCGASGLVGGQVLAGLMATGLPVLAPTRRPLTHRGGELAMTSPSALWPLD